MLRGNGFATEIGGQVVDAVYCMGGAYGPRLVTLEWHLRGTAQAQPGRPRRHRWPDDRTRPQGTTTSAATAAVTSPVTTGS